jgi:hypothetical protein
MTREEYDNTNRFVLFWNEDKKTEKHPDYSGTLDVDGVQYFIDGWQKETQSGKTIVSGSIKLKEKQGGERLAHSPPPERAKVPTRERPREAAKPSQRSRTVTRDGFDEDIPF